MVVRTRSTSSSSPFTSVLLANSDLLDNVLRALPREALVRAALAPSEGPSLKLYPVQSIEAVRPRRRVYNVGAAVLAHLQGTAVILSARAAQDGQHENHIYTHNAMRLQLGIFRRAAWPGGWYGVLGVNCSSFLARHRGVAARGVGNRSFRHGESRVKFR